MCLKVQARKDHCRRYVATYPTSVLACMYTVEHCYVCKIQARANIPSLSESTLRRDIASSGVSASPEIQVIYM